MTHPTHSSTVKRYLPWVVASALFMEQLDSTIVNTAVPSMAARLHVLPLSLKAVVASYILSFAVCIAVIGALHHAFLTLSALTILSSLTFWALRPRDGESVSLANIQEIAEKVR